MKEKKKKKKKLLEVNFEDKPKPQTVAIESQYFQSEKCTFHKYLNPLNF